MSEDNIKRQVNESADKIKVETKIKRGTGTRNQDAIKVKVKGNDADDVVDKLNRTVENLRETADKARSMQPNGKVEEQ